MSQEHVLAALSVDSWLSRLAFWTPATAVAWARVAGLVLETFSWSSPDRVLPGIRQTANQIFWSVWSLPLSPRARRRFVAKWWAEVGVLTDVGSSGSLIDLLIRLLPACGLVSTESSRPRQTPRRVLKRSNTLFQLLAHAFREDNVLLWDALVSCDESAVCSFLTDRSLIRSVLMAPLPWGDYIGSAPLLSRKGVVHRLIDPAAPWNAGEYMASSPLDPPRVLDRSLHTSPIYQVAHLALVHQDESVWNDLVQAFPNGTEPCWPILAAELVYSGRGAADRLATVKKWLRRPDPFWSRMDTTEFARCLMDNGRFHSFIFRAVSAPSVLELFPSLADHMDVPDARRLFRQELIRLALGAEPVSRTKHWPEHLRLAYREASERLAVDLLNGLITDAEERPQSAAVLSCSFAPAPGDDLPLGHAGGAVLTPDASSRVPQTALDLPAELCPDWARFLFCRDATGQAVLTAWAAPLSRHWALERLVLAQDTRDESRPSLPEPARLM